jgi:acetyl esterase/lipase
VHGGGWIAGHRSIYTGDLAFLVEDGRTVANLDYPLAPEAPHPEPLRALLRALAHLRSEDPRFERVHLIGDSAGGNLVVMLALLLEDRSRLEPWAPGAAADTHPEIASVVSLYGVLDRLSWLEHRFPMARLMMRSYGGPAALEPSVGPELAITPVDLEITSGPPVWIAYGDRDRLAESSRLGARHLEEAGVRTHLECHPGEQHGFFNFASRPESQRLRSDILRFLAEIEAETALPPGDGSA